MIQSVDGLINDFASKSSSKYKAAYVYFTDCKYLKIEKITDLQL